MRDKSAYQRILEIIDKNDAVFQNNREYQAKIDNLLGKISSPADRIQSLSILLESNLSKLSTQIARYKELHQFISRNGSDRSPGDGKKE